MGKPGLKLSVDVEAAREDEHESGEAESRESSPRVAKALFQSGSEGESDKENDTKLVETVRHRQRRNERRHEFLASPMGRRRSRDHRHSPLPSGRPSPASSGRSVSPPWSSPSMVLASNLGTKLAVKSPPLVDLTTDLVGRRMLLKLAVKGSTTPRVRSMDELKTICWLGTGVSGEVHKVKVEATGSCYAVKRSTDELRSVRERDLLLQEIRMVSKISPVASNFDHIARYYQAWQENGYFFLLLELCEGGTLKDFLARHNRPTLSESCVWHILHHTASGLAVLHDHGIVHLDIKPENLFIALSGALKIGDFGMATEVIAESTAGTEEPEGDAAYMAPELLSSSNRLPPADIFCLGISMFEVVSGRDLPSEGDEWHALRQARLPSMPADYSDELHRLIAEMMHPDPTCRPTASAVVHQASKHQSPESVATFLEHVRHRVASPVAPSRASQRAQVIKTPRKRRISLP